jgi:hypothetical protein
MPRLTALKMTVCKDLAVPGEENCRCQNHFGMDDRGKWHLNSTTFAVILNSYNA